MAGSDSSKDTQEEKPRLNQTDLPSCLNLILPRKEQWPNIFEGSANNSMYCMKDKGTEELRNYICFSEGTQQILSNFSSAQIYSPIQFLKEEQELRLESYKCWPNIFEGSANNSMYCMKDKGTEELSCRNYIRTSELMRRNCSTIDIIPAYNLVQYFKEEQKPQQELQLGSCKCRPNIIEGSANNSMYCMKDKGTEELSLLKREIQKRTSWNRKIMKALTGDTNPHPTTTLGLKMNIKHKLRSQKD